MIQRIQTLYMIIAIGAMVTFLFVPFGDRIIVGPIAGVETRHPMSIIDQEIIYTLPVFLTIGCLLYAIFKFKNHTAQKVLIIISILFAMASLGAVAYILVSKFGEAFYASTVFTVCRYGCFFPAGAIVFLVFAFKAVADDQKLLRSYNRMR